MKQSISATGAETLPCEIPPRSKKNDTTTPCENGTAMLELTDVLNDLFHNCAVIAFAEEAAGAGSLTPCMEKTRNRAYQLYEQSLAESNAEQCVRAHCQGPRRRPKYPGNDVL